MTKNVMPALDAFKEIREGIGLLYKNKLRVQSLILTYSAIDFAGWLDSPDVRASGGTFKRWVDNYMLPNEDLSCTAEEIWGARCGIVHTHTPESNRSRDGKARELHYVWEDDLVSKLQGFIDLGGKGTKPVAVKGEALILAFGAGLNKFLKGMQDNSDCFSTVQDKSAKVLTTMTPEDLQDLEYRQAARFAELLRDGDP